MKKENTFWLSIGLLLLLSLIWGSSFILIKKGLIAFGWHQVAALRITVTMLAFLPVVARSLKKIDDKKIILYSGLMGILGSGLPAFLYPIAQTHIDSSLAGLLNSATPIATLIVGVLWFNVAPERNKTLGVLLGIVGVGLLLFYGQAHKKGGNNWYGLFILLGTLSYGISGNIIKKHLQNVSPLTTSAIAFFCIGPLAMLYLFSTDFVEILQTNEKAWLSLASVATLAICSTAIGTVLYVKLIQLTNPVFGSMISYLAPIVAITFGFLDGEKITIWHFIGIALILGGITLTNKLKVEN